MCRLTGKQVEIDGRLRAARLDEWLGRMRVL